MWCGERECEENIYEESRGDDDDDEEVKEGEIRTKMSGGVKSLCMPLDQEKVSGDGVCVKCGKKAVKWVLWGRSY